MCVLYIVMRIILFRLARYRFPSAAQQSGIHHSEPESKNIKSFNRPQLEELLPQAPCTRRLDICAFGARPVPRSKSCSTRITAETQTNLKTDARWQYKSLRSVTRNILCSVVLRSRQKHRYVVLQYISYIQDHTR